MKLQRLVIASAVCAAFAGTAYAQQQQDSTQQQDPMQQQGDSMQQQDSMQQGGSTQANLDEQTIRDVQQKLKDAGYDVGQVDGKWGPRTNAALQKFQQAQGIQASGELDQQTLSALGVEGTGTETFAEQPPAGQSGTSNPAAQPDTGAGTGGATDPGATGGGADTGAGGGAGTGAGGTR